MGGTASAQTRIRLGAGAQGTSKLVGDRVNPFEQADGLDLTGSIGPVGSISVSFPMGAEYQLRLGAELTSLQLDVQDRDAKTSYRFGALRTLTLLAMGEGDLTAGLVWQAGVGQIIYLPAERVGLFQDGGPARWLLAAGVSRSFPLNARVDLSVSARFDYHQFMTATLRDRGFSQFQAVQRVTLGLGLERVF